SQSTALPVVLAANESVIQAVHAQLPWWATIMGLTCVLRSSLTLPIAVYQQRSIGKMIQLAPMIQSWGSALRTQIANESKQKGRGYARYNRELQKQYRNKVAEIYAHYGCPRWKLLSLPYVQIPLWVSMSLTLRHISGYPLPWYGQTSEGPAQGLTDGGFAWVTDLTVPDPTMTFPLLIGAGTLLNIEVK
ncbi:membrane insertase OXA1/ALB3/YidC, partial [Zychaea mexicana]|uniref:membrane insertase OXA1/ALB3/YidC n=1 Tax=Zychaea mexicana TaxID=64656 RepID=UPI0022FE7425